MQPLLTIAIPTYNRSRFLGRQIESVVGATSCINGVEVLICDNASTDTTQKVVEKASREHKNISYFRQDTNVGLDGNVYSCYEHARGSFVWFLSDDDILLDAAVGKVVETIKCSDNAQVLVFSFLDGQAKTVGENSLSLHENFDSSEAIEDFFKTIMISALVLKKEDIDIASLRKMQPSVFPQLTLALLLLKKNFTLISSDTPLVQREPGYVTKNFFELYCLLPRVAIRHADWVENEHKLLKYTEKNIFAFIKLQFLERVGYFKSKESIDLGRMVDAIIDFNFRPSVSAAIIAIYIISKMPNRIARIVFYSIIYTSKISFSAVLKKRSELKTHIKINISNAKISDV